MRAKRAEFTDEQKAEIYVRDRALCSYSGLSLWLLDYGASDIFNIDWVDHMRPAARGGRAELDNGLCASGLYNMAKRTGERILLYTEGIPTPDFLRFHGIVPIEVARHLRRFSRLHVSDWYFNRAVFNTLLGAVAQFERRRSDGRRMARGTEYRAKAALKFLSKWKQLIEKEKLPDMKSRGLLPATPSRDQKLLLGLFHATTVPEISRISKALAPYLKASSKAIDRLSEVTTLAEAKALLSKVRRDRFVTPRIRRTVELNLRRLGLLSKAKGRGRN